MYEYRQHQLYILFEFKKADDARITLISPSTKLPPIMQAATGGILLFIPCCIVRLRRGLMQVIHNTLG
jgi:hypothetical protein